MPIFIAILRFQPPEIANICVLAPCAHNSKTYDAILSTTSIFSFMPIFFPILHFKPLEIADTCIFAGCMRYNAHWAGTITNSLF